MPARFRSPILPLTLSASRSLVARDTTRDPIGDARMSYTRPIQLVAWDPWLARERCVP
jgi:hypothetical protein